MGVSLSWIASKVKFSEPEIARIQDSFNAERKRSTEWLEKTLSKTLPNRVNTRKPPEAAILVEQQLPSGWWLIMFERCDIIHTANDQLAVMSSAKGREIIACFVEEHVNYSQTVCYRDGARVWSVVHDNDKGERNLQTEGNPPPEYKAVADDLMHKQITKADCDYLFDVPVELANKLVGYRYDRVVIKFLKP